MRILVIIFLFFYHDISAQSQVVPEFSLARMDNGKPFQRKDLESNKSTLFLFLDTECSHCQEALSTFNANYKQLGSITVILVSMKKKASVVPFLKKYGVDISQMKNTTILLDDRYEFITKFKPVQYPGMFLYSPSQHLILYSHKDADIPDFISKINAEKSR